MSAHVVAEIMLYVAAAAQIAAGVVALLLIPLSGRRWFWVLISIALVVQGWRRLYPVLATSQRESAPQAASGLVVSVLLLVGLIGIRSFFISHRRISQELRLERITASRYLDIAAAMIVVLDPDGRVQRINEQVSDIIGQAIETARGADWFDTLVPKHLRREARAGFVGLVRTSRGTDAYAEYPILDKDGDEHQVVWHHLVLRDEEGTVLGVRCAGVDVTDRKRMEDELAFRSLLLDRTTDSVIVTEMGGTIVYANDAACALRGDSEAQLLGRDIRQVLTPNTAGRFDLHVNVLRREGSATFEVQVENADGIVVPLELHAHLVREGPADLIVVVARDIAERKEAEKTIRHIAYHDGLTGLPNRALLRDRATMVLGHARRQREPVALIFADVDSLKLMNDTLGHSAGDELLRVVAGRLGAMFREGDTVARFGGDEFVILLPATGREAAAKAAKKILEMTQEAFSIHGREARPTLSLGVTVFPEDGKDLDVLLANADVAMYAAKRAGRDQYRFHATAVAGEDAGEPASTRSASHPRN